MDHESSLSFEVLDNAAAADVDYIHNGLRGYNEKYAELGHKPLYVFIRDENGRLVGGLLGDTYWGWLSIHIVWIDERFRGQGYGERLLFAAEAEARKRGCAHIQLDTLSFQARPFYEKLGYRVYGTLADFPAGSGYSRYYMTKDIE